MPIYEYVCNDCTNAFETIVDRQRSISCPVCDSTALDRQLSVFAVGTVPSAASRDTAVAPCGTCGDIRGTGSCSLN